MTVTRTRSATLRQILLDHKLKGQRDVDSRIREGRTPRAREVGDELDSSDADLQNGLDLTLLQMRAADVARIDHALVRLAAGHYGSCLECGEDIAARRLRALPFAVRCHECEQERETDRDQARSAFRIDRTSLSPDRLGT